MTGLDDSKFIEAEVFEVPREAHLTSETPHVSAAPEAVLSHTPGAGRHAKPGENLIQEHNQTKASDAPAAATHGPVAVYTPSPIIPSYLQEKELKASVVIEFLVSSLGAVTPRLLASSGNEELDAIALTTAGQWQFRPAEEDHKPLDSKVRLRIVFEVR